MKIQNKIIKVTLVKVIPGHEVEVARKIEKGLLSQKVLKKTFRIFRLFGNYDILLIQDIGNISSKTLAKAGVIPFITGSREFLCFGWEMKRVLKGISKNTFDISLMNKSF